MNLPIPGEEGPLGVIPFFQVEEAMLVEGPEALDIIHEVPENIPSSPSGTGSPNSFNSLSLYAFSDACSSDSSLINAETVEITDVDTGRGSGRALYSFFDTPSGELLSYAEIARQYPSFGATTYNVVTNINLFRSTSTGFRTRHQLPELDIELDIVNLDAEYYEMEASSSSDSTVKSTQMDKVNEVLAALHDSPKEQRMKNKRIPLFFEDDELESAAEEKPDTPEKEGRPEVSSSSSSTKNEKRERQNEDDSITNDDIIALCEEIANVQIDGDDDSDYEFDNTKRQRRYSGPTHPRVAIRLANEVQALENLILSERFEFNIDSYEAWYKDTITFAGFQNELFIHVSFPKEYPDEAPKIRQISPLFRFPGWNYVSNTDQITIPVFANWTPAFGLDMIMKELLCMVDDIKQRVRQH